MRISDWSSDVCSSDLQHRGADRRQQAHAALDAPADLSAVQQVDWMERVEGVDLHAGTAVDIPAEALLEDAVAQADRKSVVSGKSGSVRVDLGGCRPIKKKITIYTHTTKSNRQP